MKKIIFLFFCLFAVLNIAEAKYTQTCEAKYRKNYGWSDYYTVEVTFMSGSELNQATQTFDYQGFSIYAIIFWDQGEASVIKISSFTGCGGDANEGCIKNRMMNLDGEDQSGKDWEICTGSPCF